MENQTNLALAPKMMTVQPEQSGQRLDNFLFSRLKGVPKSRIYRIIRKGEVRVNKKRVTADYRLGEGDQLRIPPIRTAEKSEIPPINFRQASKLEASIIYEDEGLIAINKPAGMAVHGGSGVSLGVIEALRKMRPLAKFLELVHRLDKGTSGCLLIAKKASVLKYLHEALRQGTIHKQYLAFVKGNFKSFVRVDARLVKFQLQGNERIVKVDKTGLEGSEAITEFKVLERFKNATLIEASPITGRTHQIRVHASHIGHPIAGDEKYGDDLFNKEMKKGGLKRMFLHAHKITLTLPSKKKITIEAPLEKGLTDFLRRNDV